MAQGKVGRPRQAGDRYPSGKLKPANSNQSPVVDFERKPMTGAMWQRLVTDGQNLFGDQRFATEVTRLGAIGELAPSEVATAIRIAGIYGRFEYYQGIKRAAASPYYARGWTAEAADSEADPKTLDQLAREFAAEDLAERERLATEEFKDLQAAIHRGQREALELLCVDNRHVSYGDLLAAKDAFVSLRTFFKTMDEGGGKKLTRKERERLRARRRLKPVAKDPVLPAAPRPNPLKEAYFATQRKLAPHLSNDDLEEAWMVLCAMKDRNEFRLSKSKVTA